MPTPRPLVPKVSFVPHDRPKPGARTASAPCQRSAWRHRGTTCPTVKLRLDRTVRVDRI